MCYLAYGGRPERQPPLCSEPNWHSLRNSGSNYRLRAGEDDFQIRGQPIGRAKDADLPLPGGVRPARRARVYLAPAGCDLGAIYRARHELFEGSARRQNLPRSNHDHVAGNLKEIFARLVAADDLHFKAGVDSPTLRLDDLTVAGA